MEGAKMKILITGSDGFVGKNLTRELHNQGYRSIFTYDVHTPEEKLENYLKECDFLFHLAGANRPDDPADFLQQNRNFTCRILESLTRYGNCCPIVACSSVQAEQDNLYGKSKKAMEEALQDYSAKTHAPVYIFRLPNLFGKWCRPNYNSVVATFCYNIARNIPITLTDPEKILTVAHIDSVLTAFTGALTQPPPADEAGFCLLPAVYRISLGALAEKLQSFQQSRFSLILPTFLEEVDQKLYSTFISYLPVAGLTRDLEEKSDERGAFCECLKGIGFGQIAVSVTRPGMVRGGHWHHTKTEKFCVLRGQAIVRLQRLDGEKELLEYHLTGKQPKLLDIPPGYVHWVENTGHEDMILLIWCCELFDPERPDTYYREATP